jgi:hypothetical protein
MRNPRQGGTASEGTLSQEMVAGQSRATTPGGASGVPGLVAAGTAVRGPAAAPRGPEKSVKRFRVLNGGTIVVAGMRMALRAGKELDERGYDIVQLKRQGIRLEELVDDSPPADEVAQAPGAS